MYAGVIDAVLPDAYGIVFDKEDLVAPAIVRDADVRPVTKIFLKFSYQDYFRSSLVFSIQ